MTDEVRLARPLIIFGSRDASPMSAEAAVGYRREVRTPNCMRCGRFCRIVGSGMQYDGQGTQMYCTFECSRCGTYEESMW